MPQTSTAEDDAENRFWQADAVLKTLFAGTAGHVISRVPFDCVRGQMEPLWFTTGDGRTLEREKAGEKELPRTDLNRCSSPFEFIQLHNFLIFLKKRRQSCTTYPKDHRDQEASAEASSIVDPPDPLCHRIDRCDLRRSVDNSIVFCKTRSQPHR